MPNRKKETMVIEEPPLRIDDPGVLDEIDAEIGTEEELTPDIERDIEALEVQDETLPQLRALMKPTRDKFVETNGGLYLPVRQRIVWMRGEPQPHPEWLIQTELMQFREGEYQGQKSVLMGMTWQDVPDVKGGLAVVQARVLTVLPNGKEGPVIGEGMAMERSELFHDFVEKAETSAIGRALAVAGYGTEAAADLDEGRDNVADAPIRMGPGVPRGPESNPPPGDINITPSAIQGIRQGGRQARATTAQIAAIRQRAGELMLSPSALQQIVREIIPPLADVEGASPEFYTDDVDDTPDGINLVLGFLVNLSFEECGKVVLGLADPAR